MTDVEEEKVQAIASHWVFPYCSTALKTYPVCPRDKSAQIATVARAPSRTPLTYKIANQKLTVHVRPHTFGRER